MADSLWLVCGSCHNVAAKQKDAYMMRTCYGSLCRMKHMDLFDGWFIMASMVPAAIASWAPGTTFSALVVTSGLVIAHPCMIYVGFCMSIGNLLPGLGPMLFVVLSSVFGANLVWRGLDPAFEVPEKFCVVVSFFHLTCFGIMIQYAVIAYCVCPKLKYTFRLAHDMEDKVIAGAKWDYDANKPVNFVPDASVADAAAKEQKAMSYIPLWRTFGGIIVVMAGLAIAIVSNEFSDDDSFKSRDWLYINLVVIAVSEVFLFYCVISCSKGGFGRKHLGEFEHMPSSLSPI